MTQGRNPFAPVPRGPAPYTKSLLALLLCLGTVGCMALQLAGRGAPVTEMRELVVDVEPLDVPAHGSDHGEMSNMTKPVWVRMPEAGWIHGWDYTLTDANGQDAPRGALHHFKVLDPDVRELFYDVMLHVVASGEETDPVTLPKEIGYRMEAGDSLLLTAMFHNPTHHDLEGLQLQVTLTYSPEGSWEPPMDIQPFFAHVSEGWEDVSYDVPPGRSQRSKDLVPAVTGRALALGGHMHRYGELLMLQSMPDGKVIWEGRVEAEDDGTVLHVPQDHYVWSQGPVLAEGRTYRITAVYNNPTNETLMEGGMATFGGVMVPEGAWPAVDRTSEEYAWYLARELGEMGGMGNHNR